jgi:hypothetical protein
MNFGELHGLVTYRVETRGLNSIEDAELEYSAVEIG